jgi:hypothetical protein
MELMAVIAIGHPRAGSRTSQRKKIEDVLIREL